MTSTAPRHTVLLAEDHADTRMFYAELFRASSFDVIETGRGDKALELARENLPTLIITDLSLPGITGLELAKALKADAATRAIPILCLSGYSDSETSDAAAACGIDRLVAKPCMPDDLIAHALDLIKT